MPTSRHSTPLGQGRGPVSILEPTRTVRDGRFIPGVVALLLAMHAGLLAYAATRHSPTINEPAQLAAGLAACRYGRFDLYQQNPPLVRMIAALPVLASDAVIDAPTFDGRAGIRSAGTMGREFIRANGGHDSFRYFTLARWACIPFSLMGGYVCFRWARELCGDCAGLLALAFWCFSPNVIANGQLVTTDIAAAALGATALYFLRNWLCSPTWPAAMVAGALLGLAELAKFTWLALFLLWPVLWILWRLLDTRPRSSPRSWMRDGLQLLVVMGVALYVVNLGYGFNGSFTRLGRFVFVSETLGDRPATPVEDRWHNRFSGSWLAEVPVPLPAPYVRGLDLQMLDFEDFPHPSYLAGRFREEGWWYYYLYGLGVKVPLGAWVLGALVAVRRLAGARSPVSARDESLLLLPLLTVLCVVSSQTGFSHHFRYVLPIFPFAMVWLSQVVSIRPVSTRWPPQWLPLCATGWMMISSLAVYPHSLSYFNELVGGPNGGRRHMIMSSLDWGQDLIYLQEWIDRHPRARPMHVACYAPLPLNEVGLDYPAPPSATHTDHQTAPFTLAPGWYAVSVNYLCGYPWEAPAGAYTYFSELEPPATVGYSIYLFQIREPQSLPRTVPRSPDP